ncbi:MAG: hypothetical protein JWP34_4683 [Massilia sp.]|nr:hypothetical protein [Massilia sp.]
MSGRKSVTLVVAGSLLLWLAAATARAEHFVIELTATASNDKATSGADTFPPAEGHKPRPVCHAKVGEPLVLQFFVTSNFPHNTIKNVKIRYFVVAQEKAGQAGAPPRNDAPIAEGEFVMDFKPETGKVGLRQKLHIDKKGVYLVRVESENSDSDHEHFSALDLVIE